MEIKRVLAWCGAGTLVCSALLLGRIVLTSSSYFYFLFWNLFLAAVPLGCALLFEPLLRKLPWIAVGLFVVWLLFLPNAPYLVTDFIHLRNRPPVPIWFDALLLSSFAIVGCAMGYASLALMHNWAAWRYGTRCGWVFVLGVLVLSSFAIYAGRVLRWNSWHVVTRPEVLLETTWERILDPFGNVRLLLFAGVTFALLMAGYGWSLTLFGVRLPMPASLRGNRGREV